MPYQLEAFKIAERPGANTGRLFLAMMLALVVGVLLTFWIFPYTLYKYGATTAGELLGAGSQAYGSLSDWIQYPNPPDYVSGSVIGVSFLFAIGMMWM